MTLMILGLVIFLGMHSVRIFAEDWRNAQVQRFGLLGWKGLYSVVSIVGLAVAIIGYGEMRVDPLWLWNPPAGLRHLAFLLMVPAFILLVAAYVPRNHLRIRLGHPMVLAVKVWALAHLLVNGRLGDMVFFGAFLVWAVLDFRAARRRPPAGGSAGQSPLAVATAATVVVGLAAYYVFAFHLHRWVAGVALV